MLADVVVVVHVAFVLFVLLGGLLVLRWPVVAWAHVPAAMWGAWVELASWVCPLTPLENWLRQRGGDTGYDSTFVEHYIVPVLYPAALTRDMQWMLAGIVIAVNAAVYTALVFRVRARRKKRRCASDYCFAARGETPASAFPDSTGTVGSTLSRR